MADYSETKDYSKTKDYSYDIVLVGDAGVGKSSLLRRHIDGHFEPLYIATLGSAPAVELKFRTNYGVVRLLVTDTAGQEKFGDGFDGAVFVFDLTSRVSYRALKQWLPTNIPAVLCGNKFDIADTERYRKMRLKSIPRPFFAYYETSAKSQYNFCRF